MTPMLMRSLAPMTRPDDLLSDLANAVEATPSALTLRKSLRFCSDIELLFREGSSIIARGHRRRVAPRFDRKLLKIKKAPMHICTGAPEFRVCADPYYLPCLSFSRCSLSTAL